MKKLIDVPQKYIKDLNILAAEDDKKTKPFIEMLLIDHIKTKRPDGHWRSF